MAVQILVREEARQFEGEARGQLELTVETAGQASTVKLPIRVKIIPAPPRHRFADLLTTVTFSFYC